MTRISGLVTHISPGVLNHLLAGREERLEKASCLNNELMSGVLITILHAAEQSIDIFDQTRYGVRITCPSGDGEVNCLGHVD